MAVSTPSAQSLKEPGATLEVDTPHGLARVELRRTGQSLGALILGHGAGGGIDAPDLVASAQAAREVGFDVALVEQPYRVAGRRTQAPARQLDAAWSSVLAHLRAGPLQEMPLVVGGRSAGARVACRTSAEVGAAAVLCLAFPLHPPGKAGDPSKSRFGELDAVRVPVLVIQGNRDPFGIPPSRRGRTVVRVEGTHALRARAAIEAAVADWLPRSLAPRPDQ